MKSLLDEKFAPTTSTIGFVEAPLDVVANAFSSWLQTLPQFSRVESESLESGLASALTTLSPLGRKGATKELCVAHGGWTGLFSNGWRGSDPDSSLRHLGDQVLRCRTVFAQAVPHTVLLGGPESPGRQGGVQFYLKDPVNAYERGISVTFDGRRGTFDQIGEPLPFESTDSYTARRLWDRFNSTHLEALCAELGIRLFDPAAYGRAVRFDLETVGDWGREVIELADAQAAQGIVPGQAAALPG